MNINKTTYQPPAHYNQDEKAIWQLLIYRDFVAFCKEDWPMIADDFIADGFFGIDGKKSADKATWSLSYPSLEAYKRDWIHQSQQFNQEVFTEDPLDFLFNHVQLASITIHGDTAFVHKVFNGQLGIEGKAALELNWLSLFVMRRVAGAWKIQSFTGYLPRT